jgi:DNA polymerase-3 subunit alpha
MIYQEQVMQIASEMAGFTMGEADILRRAMGKKDPEMMAQQREKFVRGAKARGVSEKKAEKIFDLMAPFAGYAFNKSHSAAYALVAYQTAYLKANYPVEFMAALLTSEMGNTDKIVRHIEECRAMGIQIQPPDVNLSGIQFTVVGETIRFGLAAIKNVGESAIQSILATRQEKGPFTSLTNFCARVELRLVNRRVIESLIKAGAADALGTTRSQLLASLDSAMEAGQRHQRDREQGQASFFDLMPPAETEPEPAAPMAMEEWEPEQLLAYEKEVLGFYLSGHPLNRFKAAAARAGAIGIGDLVTREEGSRVWLFGLPATMKEIATKSGDRMAFVTLEDMDGAIEVTIFPETYRNSVVHLRSGQPLLVRGKLEGSDDGRKILAEEIRLLDLAEEPPPAPAAGADPGPSRCRIRVATGEGARELLDRLREACRGRPGPVPLYLHIRLADGAEVVIQGDGGVRYDAALVEAVEAILGPGSVVYE